MPDLHAYTIPPGSTGRVEVEIYQVVRSELNATGKNDADVDERPVQLL